MPPRRPPAHGPRRSPKPRGGRGKHRQQSRRNREFSRGGHAKRDRGGAGPARARSRRKFFRNARSWTAQRQNWHHRAEALFAPIGTCRAQSRASRRAAGARGSGGQARFPGSGDRDRRGKPVAQAGEWRDVFGRTRGIGKPRRRGGSAYPAARGPSVGRYARKPGRRAICSSRPGDYRDRIRRNRPALTKASSDRVTRHAKGLVHVRRVGDRRGHGCSKHRRTDRKGPGGA